MPLLQSWGVGAEPVLSVAEGAGGRTFRSDLLTFFSVRLQPLRKNSSTALAWLGATAFHNPAAPSRVIKSVERRWNMVAVPSIENVA
jgi:hypothetical protein